MVPPMVVEEAEEAEEEGEDAMCIATKEEVVEASRSLVFQRDFWPPRSVEN